MLKPIAKYEQSNVVAKVQYFHWKETEINVFYVISYNYMQKTKKTLRTAHIKRFYI